MNITTGLTDYESPGDLIEMVRNGHPYKLRVTPPVVVPAAKFGAVMDGRNNTDAFMRAHDEVVRQGGGWVQMGAGDSVLDCMEVHPTVSWRGAGRSITRITTADGQTAKSDGIAGPRDQALFYVLARSRDSETVENYYPEFRDFKISGNKLGQAVAVHNIHFENSEQDPDYASGHAWGTKGYASGRIVNMEIHSASGSGVSINGGRHRGLVENIRGTGNLLNGYECKANDNIVGPRCGFGSNSQHQVKFSGCSGALMTGANVWGGGLERSDSCLAVQLFNTNDAIMVWNVINDTITITGNNNKNKPLVIAGNIFKPHEEYFSANGVPVGTASADRNAHIYVDSTIHLDVIGNGISCAPNPYMTFAYMLSAVSGAGVNFKQAYSTHPETKPYATQPVLNDGTCTISEDLLDLYMKVATRSGMFAYGWNSSVDIAALLGATAIAQNPQVMGGPLWLYNAFGGVENQSTQFISMVNAGSTTVLGNKRTMIFSTNVAAYGVVLPAFTDGFMCREVTLFFIGTVGALTVTPSAGDTILNAASIPAAIAAPYTRLDFVFKPSTREWILMLNEVV